MIKFEKNGEMIIGYDDKKPQYGFLCQGNTLEKFVLLTEKMPSYVELPNIYDEMLKSEIPDKKLVKYSNEDIKKLISKDSLKIGFECFKGRGNVVINIPFDKPVIVEPYSFDEESKVVFLLKSDKLMLKSIFHHYQDENFVRNRDFFALLPKDIEGQFNYPNNEKFKVKNYDGEIRYDKLKDIAKFSTSIIPKRISIFSIENHEK